MSARKWSPKFLDLLGWGTVDVSPASKSVTMQNLVALGQAVWANVGVPKIGVLGLDPSC